MKRGHGKMRAQGGAVLIWVIAVILLLATLLVATVTLNRSATPTVLVANSANRAQLLAESGRALLRGWPCAQRIDLAHGDVFSTASGDHIQLIDLLWSDPADPQAGGTFRILATVHAGSALQSRAEAFGTFDVCADDPGGGGVDGDSPDDYVAASWGVYTLPSGANVDGSIYGAEVELLSASTVITGNVISETSVRLGTGTRIGGYVCATAGDVELRASNVVVSGNVYAFGDVIIASGNRVDGSVFATGSVTLQSANASIGGDVHAGGGVVSGSRGNIGGSIYTAGNALLNNQTSVAGDVHAGNWIYQQSGAAASIAGIAYAGGNRNDFQAANIGIGVPPRVEPSLPAGCPPKPPRPLLQSFAAGTVDVAVAQNSTLRLSPGSYRDLDFGGNATLILQAGSCSAPGQQGCYMLRSFGPQRWSQKLRLDLSTGDYLHVFVTGNIVFTGAVEVSTDGVNWYDVRDQLSIEDAKLLAKRVYWETHGEFRTGNSTEWFGTVLSVGDIDLGNRFFGVGAFVSRNGRMITQSSNPVIIYSIADFARENWTP